jgi:CubicO group peptidase (beta-lactamase class C family)
MKRFSICLIFVSMMQLAPAGCFAATPTSLQPGQSLERRLAAGQRHQYLVELLADQFLLLEVDQRGLDVVVRVFDPAGNQLMKIDQLGVTGAEMVSLVTASAGDHRIEITPFGEEPGTGSYGVHVLRQEAVADTPEGKIEQMLSPWDRPGTPGAAVAVVRDGKMVYSGGFGRANVEHDIPITTATVFDIASVAKQFTGMAVAMLVQQGNLSLEDDYRKYLPEMPDFGSTITIDHLLHHTSGIRDWTRLLAIAGGDFGDVIPFERVLALARRQRELNFPPGTELEYSNTNYNLLAEIVSRVTGTPFPEWADQHLFEPLGMASTHFQSDPEAVVTRRATGYYRGRPEWRLRRSSNNLAAYGSSSLFTTVEDLARWAINFDTLALGGKEVKDLMLRPVTLQSGVTTDYGFGLSLGEHGGLPTVGHSGGWASFRTALLRFPEQRLTVMVLANSSRFDSDGMALKVAELYLPEARTAVAPPQPDGATVAEPPQPDGVTPGFKMAPKALKAYTGYYLQENGELTLVQVQEDRLIGRTPGQPPLVLVPQSADVFIAPQLGAQVLFDRDDQGEVRGASVSMGPHQLVFQRFAPFQPEREMLAQYVGRYFSPELETFYEVALQDGALVASHRRLGSFPLQPTIRDRFWSDRRPLGSVVFERNENGAVMRMLISTGGRVRNLGFDRQGD